MPINWFTVVAQAINFLILVWLLKRFLYKPILHAIDEREKGIAARLAKADADKAEAQKDRDEFQLKNEAFARQREALLKKATDDAAEEGERLRDQARKEADLLRGKPQEALRNELRDLNREITRWVRTEVFAIARKTLADLASASLEERMAEAFVLRLRSLTGSAKEQLTAALKSSAPRAVVRSAFDLPPAQRTAIESAIEQTFGMTTPVQFETVPEVVSGIELSVNGQKVSWSIADFLTALEKSSADLLSKDDDPVAKPNLDGEALARRDPKVAAKPAPKNEVKVGPNIETNHGLQPAAPKAAH